MTVPGLRELEEVAVKLEANARKLPTGPIRDELLQDIAIFSAQVAALNAGRSTFSTRDSHSITAAATAASRFLFSLASASRSSLSRASILASSLSISLLT